MAKRRGRKYRRKARQEKAAEREKKGLSTVAEIISMENRHAVSIMADHSIIFPDLFLDVWVEGDEVEQRRFATLLGRAWCKEAKNPEDADLIIFTGGPDVDPALYGESRHPTTYFESKRDTDDISLYLLALENGIPMVGVCRGAQFGHVMNGGKLYQDIENHQETHGLWDVVTKDIIDRVSSVHHQAIIPDKGNGMDIVAYSKGAGCQTRWYNDKDKVTGSVADIEAFFYPETMFFGVQGHPEYSGFNYYAKWFIEKINDLIMLHPDIGWEGRRLRLKPEKLELRKKNLYVPVSSASSILTEDDIPWTDVGRAKENN